jgi:hypothetical protein
MTSLIREVAASGAISRVDAIMISSFVVSECQKLKGVFGQELF